jgi:DNA-binding transcriptional ArsR family regulator
MKKGMMVVAQKKNLLATPARLSSAGEEHTEHTDFSVVICVFCSNKKKFWRYKNINRNIAIHMGATKTDLFTKQQNELAAMAKAIAHPARIAILQYLVKKNACVCGDIVDELGLAQATTSQHLKELKNAGIIQGNIEGVSVCYCIEPKVWKQYKELFNHFFKEVDPGGKCC